MSWYIWGVLIFLISFAAGLVTGILRMYKKEDPAVKGNLIIEKIEGEDAAGAYIQFFEEPKTFTDGEALKLIVILTKSESQGKQG